MGTINTTQRADASETAPRRIAWVTGASSGIGRALALRLARDGWTIAASARGVDELASLAAESNGQIVAFPLDVTDGEAVKATFQAIGADLGPADLAVFAAGTYFRDYAADFDSGRFGTMVGLNLVGTAHCLEAVMPEMIARKSGQIAVVASVSGYVGLPGAASYGATKAALNVMCEAFQPELAAHGVRISIVNPGFVDTPLTRKNDFPMPFLVSAESAADSIVGGLAAGSYEIVFPWKMAVAMKLLHALPARLRFMLTRRMLRSPG
ncbi:MAG: SDR family NAD(P)-dependent oxidoreductase [Alphaproteobacteria bacterium]|nr:SDR family NAD(P)-dependent oxidoreductase [Rhizobiaceae bacterium]MBU3959690.1 SDR family NAD(P)-dependent oxidoreductase [Alphaproteobacteria bacterium]MBU4051397.1 SDR family NAD(P)-dependent oxidoreductase [Alphaproteobacteria bacterium]MBU4088433.1 SDR family NAD(P)-dependent oxidoreductase [Alphaproteobacteria bacterium]MBU4156153.1 SDR family NAD(P)-dependent oxidoreductase [Alphaproteobacteria bacterium]